jgi:hypothetical protein
VVGAGFGGHADLGDSAEIEFQKDSMVCDEGVCGDWLEEKC